MQVAILAGGLGTRLRAVSGAQPKVLVHVAGMPFVDHQLSLLAKHGINDVLLCVGYQGCLVEKHVGDGRHFGLHVRYSSEDPGRLLGTGGALVNALPSLDTSFLVLYGDSYLPTDYQAVIRAFRQRNCAAMMCVYRNCGQWDSSNVRIAGDRVTYYAKGSSPQDADYIDYGLSAFRREVIEFYSHHPPPLDLARIQMDLVGRGELAALEVFDRFYEIGKPEGLADLEGHLRSNANAQARGVGRE